MICGGLRWRSTLKAALGRGHTFGTKTAISIPDEVFVEAERLARLYRKRVSKFA